jgi:hypothetical protein
MIATLSIATGLAPSVLLVESPEMVATLTEVAAGRRR